MTAPLSIPARPSLPRELTDAELQAILRVADVLIPAHGAAGAASSEPELAIQLQRALVARADAFDAIAATLGVCRAVPSAELFEWLKALDAKDPDTFQALSTVVAGAWLLTPGVRDRIGYPGLVVDRAKFEDAADDLSSGLLDSVLARAADGPSRWIR